MNQIRWRRYCSVFLAMAIVIVGCQPGEKATGKDKQLTIGVAFETLQTEYWVASFNTIKAELEKRNIKMVEAVANGDANFQLDQITSFISQGVDGIIVAPKDAKTIVPAIEAANRANIPIVLYNRPAEPGAGVATAVVANNRDISYNTVKFLLEQALKNGKKHTALIVVGDLGDLNAVGRQQGFDDAVKDSGGEIEIIRAPSEWIQEKAKASIVNALQAHPEIDIVFTSSDFLLPSVETALRGAGKWNKYNEKGHVLLGGFDGDKTAYQMLVDGYLDADGVQDMAFECETAVQAILDMRAGKKVAPKLDDPGFVIHRGNLEEGKKRMWGATSTSK